MAGLQIMDNVHWIDAAARAISAMMERATDLTKGRWQSSGAACTGGQPVRGDVMCSFDLVSAFPSISIEYLWWVLDKLQLPVWIRLFIKTQYIGAQVSFGSQWIAVCRGVQQGDPLAAILSVPGM